MNQDIANLVSADKKNYSKTSYKRNMFLYDSQRNGGNVQTIIKLQVEYLWICPKLLIVSHITFQSQNLKLNGTNENLLAYLHSYLSNRKQCVRINNLKSDFKTVISGVPQGFIVGHILFNCFFNDFFYFIGKASVHSFEDGNTLSMFEKTIQNSIALLETESNTAIEWFQNNNMVVNPGKF